MLVKVVKELVRSGKTYQKLAKGSKSLENLFSARQ